MRLSILVASFLLVTSTLQGKIVFDSSRDGNLEIYTMNSAGENQTRLTDYDESDFSPVWSPNGQQIAFARFLFNRRGDKNEEIYVMDADGTNLRNLTQHPALDSGPSWSPDGKQIAFVAITELGRQVYAMNADGTVRWLVSEPRPNAWMHLGGWSPDGKQILYKGSINGLVTDSFVVIATLNPTRRKVVKHEEVPIPKMDLTTVSWGADGKSILFSGRKDGEKWDIYRFRLLDDQLLQLTNHPASDVAPREWNPLLPVSPQGLVPTRWGEIKSNRGIGGYPMSPVP